MSDLGGGVSEVGVRLIVDGQTVFSSDMNAAAASIGRVKEAADAANTSVGGTSGHLNAMGTAARSAGKELENARSPVKTFSSDVKGAFSDMRSAFGDFGSGIDTVTSKLGNLATAQFLNYNAWGVLTGVIGGAAAAMTYFGLKTENSLEQANIAFTQFLGNSQQAGQFVDQLKQFAATTPFDFTNLVPATQKLLNTGDNPAKALQDLRAIGDAASGADPIEGQQGVERITLAISQIKNAPALHAQDMNQLVQAGIDPYGILAQAKGTTKGKILSDEQAGKIPGAQAAEVLLAGFEQKYGGLMQKENATLAGQLSNLHDTISFTLADASKPLAQLLERDMPAITNDLNVVAKAYGHMLDTTITASQSLWQAWKTGGMYGVAGQLDQMAGTGTMFEGVWTHIKDDSSNIADIWEHSLWPAIQDVSNQLGPLAFGSLSAVEQILQWMAANPGAAKDVFEALFYVLTAYKVASLLWDVTAAITALATTFGAAGTAAGLWGAETVSSMAEVKAAMAEESLVGYGTVMNGGALAAGGAGAAGGASTAARALGAGGLFLGGGLMLDQSLHSKSTTGGLVSGALGGAGIGAGLGLIGGPLDFISVPAGAIGGGVIGGLLSLIPHHAEGGRALSTGPALVGEKGAEVVNLNAGDLVTPLNKANTNNMRGSVIFEQGAIQISAADYLNGQALGDKLVEVIQDSLARQ